MIIIFVRFYSMIVFKLDAVVTIRALLENVRLASILFLMIFLRFLADLAKAIQVAFTTYWSIIPCSVYKNIQFVIMVRYFYMDTFIIFVAIRCMCNVYFSILWILCYYYFLLHYGVFECLSWIILVWFWLVFWFLVVDNEFLVFFAESMTKEIWCYP